MFWLGWVKGCNESGFGEGERVTMGGRGEIGDEAEEVTGVVANAPTMDGLGKRYGMFSGWGMAAGKVEVLLVVGEFDVDKGAEARLINKDDNIQEGDMGRGDGPSKSDRVVSTEALKEKEKGMMTMSPQQEVINKCELKVRFRVFCVQKVLLQRSHEEISIGVGHLVSHVCALNMKVMEGVEREVVVSKDEVSEGCEEMCRRAGNVLLGQRGHVYGGSWCTGR